MQAMQTETGALDVAFQKQTETFSAQYTILKNKLNVSLIKLATVALPILAI